MAVNQYTTDGGIDVSFNSPPETAEKIIPLAKFGSIAASARIWRFVADKAYEVMYFAVAPTTIASGTLKADILVAGTTILATKATATVADTPVAATFTTTRIASGASVLVALTSDSATVTDVLGHLILRPLLGMERMV